MGLPTKVALLVTLSLGAALGGLEIWGKRPRAEQAMVWLVVLALVITLVLAMANVGIYNSPDG
jgi:uncharacterized membrane protein